MVTSFPISTEELSALGDDGLFVASQLEQARGVAWERCEFGAPYIFFHDRTGHARIVAGCCNHWECPRCGQLRALAEYGRLVHGARTLAADGHTLYFLTLTCRGREVSLADAETNYYTWTSRALDTLRHAETRAGRPWHYAQVTERQQRGHPHSHLLTTYHPTDGHPETRWHRKADGTIEWRESIRSDMLLITVTRAGLGPEYELTEVRSPQAVAVYIGKYLFKTALATKWPRGWKRIRYSQSWPKLPEQTDGDGWPLRTLADWKRVAALNEVVQVDGPITRAAAEARGIIVSTSYSSNN